MQQEGYAYYGPAAGRAGLYRCRFNGGRFISFDPNCEGQPIEGLIGYVPTDPPAIFYGDDADRRIPAEQAEWDYGHWKATCSSTEAAVGISKPTGNHLTHALLCKPGAAGAGAQTEVLTHNMLNASDVPLKASGVPKHTRVPGGWDYRNGYELECGLNEHVSGLSQKPDVGPPTFIHGVRCSAGLGSASGCKTHHIDRYQDQNQSNPLGDWDDSTYLMASCPADKVMVGVGITKSMPSSIYCCNRGSTSRSEAESATLASGAPPTILADTSAANGQYVDFGNLQRLRWTSVMPSAAGTRTLEFRVRVPSGQPNGTTCKLGVYVRKTDPRPPFSKVGTIATTSQQWEIVSPPNANLVADNNTVELRDSEGTVEPDVDFLQLTNP